MKPGVIRWILIVVLVLLGLNALAYGSYFVFSPAAGLGEFGVDNVEEASRSAVFLVSLVGAGLLGTVGFAALAIFLLIGNSRTAFPVTLLLGVTYLGVGLVAVLHLFMVDAIIYGGFGLAICILCAWHWRASRAMTR